MVSTKGQLTPQEEVVVEKGISFLSDDGVAEQKDICVRCVGKR